MKNILTASTQEQNAAIQSLDYEAGAAGDTAQASLCRKALLGDRKARKACLAVIAEAEAQQ